MITMKQARSTLLPALIFATSILLLFSCSESTEDTTKVIAESPLTGTIQGQIRPGGSHAMVELIKDNQVIHSITVDKEDKYFITHLTHLESTKLRSRPKVIDQ